jgi:hypothetical protein
VASLGTLTLLGAACGGPVAVDAPDLTVPEQRTCSELIAALPESVDGAEQRDVEPARGPTAAWGDPAIVLRCGVETPEGFDDYATCHETNGVGWFIPEEQMTGSPEPITMTTIGRDVSIEVSLPVEHFPPAGAMVDLAEAIKATTELVAPCV